MAVFSAYLRLQHPILPFITEELWHRFGQNTSIALARYPQAGATDEAAEREMGLLQDMVTAARKLKADNGLDDKLELAGVLYCRNGSRNIEFPVVEFLAKVKLEVRTGRAARSHRRGSFHCPVRSFAAASRSGYRGAAAAAD